jgi:hypothetical protein
VEEHRRGCRVHISGHADAAQNPSEIEKETARRAAVVDPERSGVTSTGAFYTPLLADLVSTDAAQAIEA